MSKSGNNHLKKRQGKCFGIASMILGIIAVWSGGVMIYTLYCHIQNMNVLEDVLRKNIVLAAGFVVASVLPIISIVSILLGIIQIKKKDTRKTAMIGIVCSAIGLIAYLVFRIYFKLS